MRWLVEGALIAGGFAVCATLGVMSHDAAEAMLEDEYDRQALVAEISKAADMGIVCSWFKTQGKPWKVGECKQK